MRDLKNNHLFNSSFISQFRKGAFWVIWRFSLNKTQETGKQ